MKALIMKTLKCLLECLGKQELIYALFFCIKYGHIMKVEDSVHLDVLNLTIHIHLDRSRKYIFSISPTLVFSIIIKGCICYSIHPFMDAYFFTITVPFS